MRNGEVIYYFGKDGPSFKPPAMNLQTYLRLWNDCTKITDSFNKHYSVQPYQKRVIFDEAIQLFWKSTVVELGVCHGHTAAMLAFCCKWSDSKYYGVDFFGLDWVDVNVVRENLRKNDLSGEIIHGNTHDVGIDWSKKSGGKPNIDLLFVDAGHDEANVRPDIEIWLPLVRPGGTVIFHDYDDPYDPASAHWAVRFYADLATEGWDRRIVDGMLVAKKPV